MAPLLTPTLAVALFAASLVAWSFVFLRARSCGSPNREALWSAVETAVTVFVGALAARTFVWSLLAVQPFGKFGVFLIETTFLFWPGLIDAVNLVATGRTVFESADVVVWATVFGGLAGFWDGVHRIHDWRRFGGLTFLLDVTSGGAATNIGVAAHFLNLGWGRPIESHRQGAHRYDAGVCTSRQYAITLGNVCGNLQGRGDGPLFRHESIHVLQNRLFGPIYLFSYLLWMAALFVPALIWGLVVGRPGEMLYGWCYANNPWEEWAYRCGGSRPAHLVWPTRRIIGVATALFIFAVAVSSMIAQKFDEAGASL